MKMRKGSIPGGIGRLISGCSGRAACARSMPEIKRGQPHLPPRKPTCEVAAVDDFQPQPPRLLH